MAAAVAAQAEEAAKAAESDGDSIGSASDLRAEDDDLFDENPRQTQAKLRRPLPTEMDGISESVKTCSSSAYHAECEYFLSVMEISYAFYHPPHPLNNLQS